MARRRRLPTPVQRPDHSLLTPAASTARATSEASRRQPIACPICIATAASLGSNKLLRRAASSTRARSMLRRRVMRAASNAISAISANAQPITTPAITPS